MWTAADYDHSGYMDAAELQFMFKRLGVEMSSTQVKALMVEIDEDKNDEISYEELIEWLMKNELRVRRSASQGLPAIAIVAESADVGLSILSF